MPRILEAPHALGPSTIIRRLHRDDLHGLAGVIPAAWLGPQASMGGRGDRNDGIGAGFAADGFAASDGMFGAADADAY